MRNRGVSAKATDCRFLLIGAIGLMTWHPRAASLHHLSDAFVSYTSRSCPPWSSLFYRNKHSVRFALAPLRRHNSEHLALASSSTPASLPLSAVSKVRWHINPSAARHQDATCRVRGARQGQP